MGVPEQRPPTGPFEQRYPGILLRKVIDGFCGSVRRPDLLDRALMRPGRLDKLLYVGVAKDAASKASVLAALTRRCSLLPFEENLFKLQWPHSLDLCCVQGCTDQAAPFPRSLRTSWYSAPCAGGCSIAWVCQVWYLPVCRFTLSTEVDLEAVARECAPTYTGADLYALCADAWMAALKRSMATVCRPA